MTEDTPLNKEIKTLMSKMKNENENKIRIMSEKIEKLKGVTIAIESHLKKDDRKNINSILSGFGAGNDHIS